MTRFHLAVLLPLAVALSACNNTESALNIQAPNQAAQQVTEKPANNGAHPSPGQAAAAQANANANQAALKAVKLQIAPIVGAPVGAVTPLTHRINDNARINGIQLAGSNDPDATHVLKGYFSVLAENGRSTVLYVWDVVDHAGNRVHRIQGQETTQGSAADSWSVITPAVMEKIADRTVQEFSSWLASKRP